MQTPTYYHFSRLRLTSLSAPRSKYYNRTIPMIYQCIQSISQIFQEDKQINNYYNDGNPLASPSLSFAKPYFLMLFIQLQHKLAAHITTNFMTTERTSIPPIKPQHLIDDSSTIQCLYTEEYENADLIDLIRSLTDYIKIQEEKGNEDRQMLKAELIELRGSISQKEGYITSLLKQIDDLKVLFNEQLEQKNKQLEQVSISQQQIKSHCDKLDYQLYEQRTAHQKYSNLSRQITEKQREIQQMVKNQKVLNQQLKEQHEYANQLKHNLEQYQLEMLELGQRMQALDRDNKELFVKNHLLQEKIDQSQYIREIIKIQDRFSDQSLKSSSNHEKDDKIKMKEIADNFKFQLIKPQNMFTTPVSDISEQFDNVSQKLDDKSKKYASNIKNNGLNGELNQSSKKYQSQLKIIEKTQKFSIVHDTPKSKELIRRRTSTQFTQDWIKSGSFGFLKKQIEAKNSQLKQVTQKVKILEEELLDKMDRIVDLEGTLEMIEDEQQQVHQNHKEQLEHRQKLIKNLEKQSALHRIQFIEQRSQLLLKIEGVENKVKHYKQALKESQLICQQYQNIINKQRNNLQKQQAQQLAIQTAYHRILQRNSLEQKSKKLAIMNPHFLAFYPQSYKQDSEVPLKIDIGLQFPESFDKECDIETQRYPQQQISDLSSNQQILDKEHDRINRDSNKMAFDDNPFEIREFLTIDENQNKQWLSFQQKGDCPFANNNDENRKEGKENNMDNSNPLESNNLLSSFRNIVSRYKGKSCFKTSILKHPIFLPSSLSDLIQQVFKIADHIGSNDGSNQSMYLITCYKKNQISKDTILLWSEGIVSLNEQKALLMKKNQRKIINDPGSYILGNCEIIVNAKTIKIRRNNKRTYLFGDLEDDDWYINAIRIFDGR